MKHLWNNYVTANIHYLMANRVRIISQWTPPAPIESLLKQLTEGHTFAAKVHEEISDSQLQRLAYENI